MKKSVILLLFFLLSYILNASQSLMTNYDILDSLVNNHSKEIITQIKTKNINKAYLKISTHSSSELLYKHLLANSNGIEFILKKTDDLITVNNIINKANVRYDYCETSSDSVFRIIEVDISTILEYQDGKTESININPTTYTELISRDDIKLIDSKEFTFTTSEIPEKKLTFYEKIAEPLIIVTTAILTVVLLFTIRSG